MVAFQDSVQLVRSEADRLKDFLGNLPMDDWKRPSACDRWEVADVVGHLAWVGEFYTQIFDRALQGTAAPPENSPDGSPTHQGTNDDFFAETAIATRRRLGDDLLPCLGQSWTELFNRFSGMDPEDQNRPCYLPAGTRPLGYLPVMSVQELAIHSWDIRSGVEEAAHLSPDILPLLVDRVFQRITQGRSPASLLGPPSPTLTRYRFELTGAVPSKKDILVANGEARLEPPGDSPPDKTFRCETETFVLLMYGRLDLDHAVANGLLEVTEG